MSLRFRALAVMGFSARKQSHDEIAFALLPSTVIEDNSSLMLSKMRIFFSIATHRGSEDYTALSPFLEPGLHRLPRGTLARSSRITSANTEKVSFAVLDHA